MQSGRRKLNLALLKLQKPWSLEVNKPSVSFVLIPRNFQEPCK